MNTPGQNVNDFAELLFDMMFHSEFEVTGRSIALHTILHESILNIITDASHTDMALIKVSTVMNPKAKRI